MNIKVIHKWVTRNWETLSETDKNGIEKVYSNDDKAFVIPAEIDFQSEANTIDNKQGAEYRKFQNINPYTSDTWKIKDNLLKTEAFSLSVNDIDGVYLKTPWWAYALAFFGLTAIVFITFDVHIPFIYPADAAQQNYNKIFNIIGWLCFCWFITNALILRISCNSRSYKMLALLPKSKKELRKLIRVLDEKIS